MFDLRFRHYTAKDRLAYKGQRGNKWVEIIWEEGEGSYLEVRGTNATYFDQLG